MYLQLAELQSGTPIRQPPEQYVPPTASNSGKSAEPLRARASVSDVDVPGVKAMPPLVKMLQDGSLSTALLAMRNPLPRGGDVR